MTATHFPNSPLQRESNLAKKKEKKKNANPEASIEGNCLEWRWSPEKTEDHTGKTKENVRNQQWSKDIRLPVRPIQNQQVTAVKKNRSEIKTIYENLKVD